jgi:hypothetical protein
MSVFEETDLTRTILNCPTLFVQPERPYLHEQAHPLIGLHFVKHRRNTTSPASTENYLCLDVDGFTTLTLMSATAIKIKEMSVGTVTLYCVQATEIGHGFY